MKCPQNLYWNHTIHWEIFCEMTWGDTLHCKVSNNIPLAKQFYVFVIINQSHFQDNCSSYEKYFLFVSSIFPWWPPFHPCPNFSQFLLHPFPHISSILSPPTVHLISSFLNSSRWLIKAKSYQSDTPMQNKKPTFRHHILPSPSQCLSHIYDLHNYPIHCIFVFNSTQ